ncbi:MAG: NifU family protein [Coriobacteriia bacterium]|nr:NifU family protein [Coriobacteriia bacterium]
MVDKQQVKDILDSIRPMLQADGGDITLISVSDDGIVEVELEGACKGCPMSALTLANSVEALLREHVSEEITVVQFESEPE